MVQAPITAPKSVSHPQENQRAEEPAAFITKQQSDSTAVSEKKPSFKNKFAKLEQQQTKTSSLSINELTKDIVKTDEEIEAEAYTSEVREKYTQDAFITTWKKLAERIRDSEVEGSSIVYAAMTTRAPLLQENFQIELAVDNKSQAEELMDRRTEIHDYLRKSLKNGGIELSVRVEKDQTKRKAYTDEEKFNRMAEENPVLLDLKRELGLDFI